MVERSADGRYVIVDGRRWRASDPDLDEATRHALVAELMAARRAVAAARRAQDAVAERLARHRVDDAKVALGERGTPWWETPTPDARRAREAATSRALERAAGHA